MLSTFMFRRLNVLNCGNFRAGFEKLDYNDFCGGKAYVHSSKSVSYTSNTHALKTTAENTPIIIPKRIPRGPTDILKALASTVKRNPSSPHYKYQDDPFLVPSSNFTKRSYALSKEAGKKAARYFLDKYPDSFAHNPADPNVPAFNAPIKLDESNPGDIEALKESINNFEVSNAVTIYKYLKTKDVAVNDDILQDLLELVCYHGSEDQYDPYPEEMWLAQVEPVKKARGKTNLIDELFNQLENKDARAYSSIIKGLAKLLQYDRAYLLYKEMKDKKLSGDSEVYALLLTTVPNIKEDYVSRWGMAEELLGDMVQDNIAPNLNVFNAVLETLLRNRNWRSAPDFALGVFSEMKICGIKPSLGSYYYLISICCKDKGPTSYILMDIMDEIEGNDFHIRHPKDVAFFVNAMVVCCNHLGDVNLAYRVHNLYLRGNNCKLIGGAYKESIYYQNLFKLVCRMEDIHKFFELYNAYVPHVYTPEPSVMEEIIEAIDASKQYSYLSKIWSDIVVFGHTTRQSIISNILSVMARSKDPELVEQWAVIAMDIKNRVFAQQETDHVNRSKVDITGQILADILRVLINASKPEEAWELIKLLHTEQAYIVGYPMPDVLQDYCKLALENGQYDRTISCLKLASEIGLTDVILEVKKLCKNLAVKDDIVKVIDNLIGDSKLAIDDV